MITRSLSSGERTKLAEILGVTNPLPMEAIREVGVMAAFLGPEEQWSDLDPNAQVGLLVEWFVSRAAATYGPSAAIEQLTKEIDFLRKGVM